MSIVKVSIQKLRSHEKVDKEHLQEIKSKILKSGIFKVPIIVDKEHLVVLDGHHRLNSCKELGLSKIPCVLVDYLKDSKIKVVARRKEYVISKDKVIKMGLSKQVFPCKTTKHYIPYRVKNLKIPLLNLM